MMIQALQSTIDDLRDELSRCDALTQELRAGSERPRGQQEHSDVPQAIAPGGAHRRAHAVQPGPHWLLLGQRSLAVRLSGVLAGDHDRGRGFPRQMLIDLCLRAAAGS